MFLELQISLLEWFLKDHVTLKNVIMAAENSASSSQKYNWFNINIIYVLQFKYIQIKTRVLSCYFFTFYI